MDFLQVVILLFFAYGINCLIVKDLVSDRRNKNIKGGIRQFSVEVKDEHVISVAEKNRIHTLCMQYLN